MRNAVVAARYAQALFLVAERRKETVRALADLKVLLEVFEPGSRVARFLASPQVRLPDKRKALEQALEGRTLRVTAMFLDLLLRKRRLGEFAGVVQEFEGLVEKAQGIQRAHVVSAVPLSAAETKRLHESLETRTRGRIKLTAEVDPRLVGGALVRIGDRVIDRSVATLLESVAHRLYEVTV